jgi:hypothetical protein
MSNIVDIFSHVVDNPRSPSPPARLVDCQGRATAQGAQRTNRGGLWTPQTGGSPAPFFKGGDDVEPPWKSVTGAPREHLREPAPFALTRRRPRTQASSQSRPVRSSWYSGEKSMLSIIAKARPSR